jgi:hypothetical protein
MYYYTPDEFGANTDKSKMLYNYVDKYQENMQKYTDYAKGFVK